MVYLGGRNGAEDKKPHKLLLFNFSGPALVFYKKFVPRRIERCCPTETKAMASLN